MVAQSTHTRHHWHIRADGTRTRSVPSVDSPTTISSQAQILAHWRRSPHTIGTRNSSSFIHRRLHHANGKRELRFISQEAHLIHRWPGQLGKCSNYAFVVAQLWTNGVCHGPHVFLVQLRDLDTHMPLKGNLFKGRSYQNILSVQVSKWAILDRNSLLPPMTTVTCASIMCAYRESKCACAMQRFLPEC